LRRASIAAGAEPRGTIRTIQPHLVFEGFGFGLFAAFLGCSRNVLLAYHEAFLETSADQTGPDHFGLETGLQGVGANALALQRLRQLIGRDPHPRAHRGVGLLDIGGGGIDAEFLGFLDLHLLVDQFVDHFLPGRLLARAQEVELGALFDIVIGDRLAVDHDSHALRPQRRAAADQERQRKDARQRER
jgi:hypothetical protein